MTTLVLMHKKIIPLSLRVNMKWTRERFEEINTNGLITTFLFVMIGCVLTAYLGGLFWTLHTGFTLGHDRINLDRLKEEYVQTEVALQRGENALYEEHQFLFESMEKISAITYLTEENILTSYILPLH